ncbi:MAG: permease [Bacteroidota bacterium]|nr:MAG: permease [Bacteroidota bacterium]
MEFLKEYWNELVALTLDMGPWLLFGFLIAGVLHVFFPEGKMNRLLGKSNMKSVLRAALIGIPLPLCSCGVIPTGISIHKNGASKGAAVSFLISTPQTGVDSILVTYSLLGLPFAIVRPIVAFFTGIMGGYLTNRAENRSEAPSKAAEIPVPRDKSIHPLVAIFKYAFVDFLQDIAKWLVIGLLVAALIAVFVPDDFFASYLHHDFLGMLIILVVSIPIYVCATSSVPIAAVLILKGLSPGAALVFLMAGPATNAATISVIGKAMGKRTLIIYLFTIISGALLSGLFIDYFLPREWFVSGLNAHHHHEHGLLPPFVHLASGILMTALIANVFLLKWMKKMKKTEPQFTLDKPDIRVFVRGMNCNHCKNTVETNLLKLEGIDAVKVNLDTETVLLEGRNVDLLKVKSTVESLGYKFES